MNYKATLRCLAYLVIAYFGLVGILLFFENNLVYRPTLASQHWQDASDWTSKFERQTMIQARIEDIELTCADGTRVHAWWSPREDDDEAILYMHGNAGNLSHRGGTILQMREAMKRSVLIVDYPGYGKSEGRPTEQGCYQAADAAYDWLIKKQGVAPNRVLLYGASLGGGVAVELASRKDHRALVLVKTFTSMPDVARDIYWFLPVPMRLLMKNRFDTIGRLPQCKRPVFIAHGTADDLIPFAHGERLYAAANEPKRFLRMDNGGHNDGLPNDFFSSLNTFLNEHPAD